MERAYSVFTLKSFDEDARTIKGIASTPTLDRHGDIVEPLGAKFEVPFPFKFEHKHVIGDVTEVTVTEEGIEITAQIAKSADSKSLTQQLDNFWRKIKSGVVRGLSVGILADPSKVQKTANGGKHFIEWILDEVSAVAVPANQDATIQAIKSFDDQTINKSNDNSTASGSCVVVKLSEQTMARIKAPKRKGAVYL